MTVVSPPTVDAVKLEGKGNPTFSQYRVLAIGQKRPSGTAVSGSLVEDLKNNGEQNTLFGEDSQLTLYVANVFKKINNVTALDIIPLDDAGGATAATATVAFSGTATESGSISVICGDRKRSIATVDIVSGDTATDVGDTLVAALTSTFPVTGVNTIGSVVLTAKNAGTIGNSLQLGVIGSVAGITVTLTGFAGGLTDPTLTGIFDVVGDKRYNDIIWPSTYAETEGKDFLEARENVSNKILDGDLYTTRIDTLANLKSTAASINSAVVSIDVAAPINTATKKGNEFLVHNDALTAEDIAMSSLRFVDGAINTRYLVSPSPKDAFGGVHLASLPFHNTPFFEIVPSDPGQGFDNTEVSELSDAGLTVIGNNPQFNQVIMNTANTTRRTNAAGNDVVTFSTRNRRKQTSFIREYFFNQSKSAYPQTRLTQGDVIDGYSLINEQAYKSFLKEVYENLGDLLLVVKGSAANKAFEQSIIIDTDFSQGLINVSLKVVLVSQLRKMQIGIEFDETPISFSFTPA